MGADPLAKEAGRCPWGPAGVCPQRRVPERAVVRGSESFYPQSLLPASCHLFLFAMSRVEGSAQQLKVKSTLGTGWHGEPSDAGPCGLSWGRGHPGMASRSRGFRTKTCLRPELWTRHRSLWFQPLTQKRKAFSWSLLKTNQRHINATWGRMLR